MGVFRENRVLTASVALAFGGVLTCGLALVDEFLPRGSAPLALAAIPLLGALAVSVLIIFARTFDLLDHGAYLSEPEKTASNPRSNWRVSLTLRTDSLGGPQPGIESALSLRPSIDHAMTIRGKADPKMIARSWNCAH